MLSTRATVSPAYQPCWLATPRGQSRALQRHTPAAAEPEIKTTKPKIATPDIDADKLVKDLKTKWEGVEDKTSVLVYAGGALAVLWLSSSLVGAINNVPLLPKLMELVGLGYTSWFVYRYLLFKESREELITDIDELKKKISGTDQA